MKSTRRTTLATLQVRSLEGSRYLQVLEKNVTSYQGTELPRATFFKWSRRKLGSGDGRVRQEATQLVIGLTYEAKSRSAEI